MKIVHVISGLGVGGAEITLLNLVKHSQNQGATHVVISLTRITPLVEKFLETGAIVKILGLSLTSFNPLKLGQLVKWIADESPDVVQTWMYHGDLVGGIAARLAGFLSPHGKRRAAIVWGIHRSEDPSNLRRATRWTARLSAVSSRFVPDKIVCCATSAYQSHARFGFARARMTVIHNGFDIALFKPARDSRALRVDLLGLDNKSIVVGIVGRFNPAKDFGNFLEAAAIVSKRLPDCRFVMVGKDVDDKNTQLKAAIQAYHLEGSVALLGSRSDIPNLIASFDLLCLSSRTEGFPTVVGEAMACGIPCVATNVGDTAYLVSDTGLIVPPSAPERLAKAIEELALMSSDERGQLGRRARTRIEEYFSIDSCWKKYFNIYSEILNKQSVTST